MNNNYKDYKEIVELLIITSPEDYYFCKDYGWIVISPYNLRGQHWRYLTKEEYVEKTLKNTNNLN